MKKIMFNDKYSLTEAVLSGRKTVTRRIVDASDKYSELRVWQPTIKMPEGLYGYNENDGWELLVAPYKVGEIVAVAQSYKDLGYSETALDRDPNDVTNVRGTLKQSGGWNNKMFVRAEACKHQIRIISMRPERLQGITDGECLKEGVRFMENSDGYFSNGLSDEYTTPRPAFAALIDKISGRGTWNKNPFVWRIEFKLVKDENRN